MLQEKHDSLTLEREHLRQEVKQKREEVLTLYHMLIASQLHAGANSDSSYLSQLASNSLRRTLLSSRQISILGIKVKYLDLHREGPELAYDKLLTTHHLDQLLHSADKFVAVLVELINLEHRLQLLTKTLTQTNRRVNSLEYDLIPELENTQTVIERKLAEYELQDKVKVMRVKGRKVLKTKNQAM